MAARLWAGRLALKIEGAESQSFFASFELQGNAQVGTLSLFSPLSTLAVMRWQPGLAWLQPAGNTPERRFASAEQMLLEVSGAPIPIAALFAWLEGRAAVAPGWSVDLSQQPQGRIVASRSEPAPLLELRLVLENE